MGTLIQGYDLTINDFEGLEGLNEILNLTHPEIIKAIHTEYLKAGSMAIETNSFGGSRIKLTEYGRGKDVYLINKRAAEIAREAITDFGGYQFVVGSMGPTGKLPSSTDPILGRVTFDEIVDVFGEQATALLDGGVDVLLLETQHDILEVKAAIMGCRQAIASSGKDIVLQVQMTVDQNGVMLYGTDIISAINIIKDLGVDVIGINCSTGPAEMMTTLNNLSSVCPCALSVLPNAGMPHNEHGKATYSLDPETFSTLVARFVNEFGVQVIGGCCGTRPAHIAALAKLIPSLKPAHRTITHLPPFSSPIETLPIKTLPYIIGERLNAQGSKKSKSLMMANDYPTLLDIAKDQVEFGADLLDLCFAMTERYDEKEQLATFTNLVAYAVTTPLSFDSTEPDVLEAAIKRYAGRPLINSINLENEKYKSILPLVKQFGLTTIALSIDEKGMARTTAEKLSITDRIVKIAESYGLREDQLMIDPLTFTLATGEEEFRSSALETLEAIRQIKLKYPSIHITLGISNISFGLTPPARKILNRVYLEHAVKAGLDFAIFHAAENRPLSEFPSQLVALATDLILNRHDTALINYISAFENLAPPPILKEKDLLVEKKSIPERIQAQIIDRRREGLIPLLETLKDSLSPPDIINTVLLPAMKEVGNRMESGEIILPFVLESAEVMRVAMTYLEGFMDKTHSHSKGTVVLATVFGDVHDIGKNLVKTIISNNGYHVIDLGKQVPVNDIVSCAIKEKADAIALSALLVTTSKQMASVVEALHKAGSNIPVLIGGAAINDTFAQHISEPNGAKYQGGVYYAKDAFSGLRLLEGLI